MPSSCAADHVARLAMNQQRARVHRRGRGLGGRVERLLGVQTRLASERVSDDRKRPQQRDGRAAASRDLVAGVERGARLGGAVEGDADMAEILGVPQRAGGDGDRARRALQQAAGGALETDATRLAMTARSDHDQVGILTLGQLGQPAGRRRGDRRALPHMDAGRDHRGARVGEHERDLLGDRRVRPPDVRTDVPALSRDDAGERQHSVGGVSQPEAQGERCLAFVGAVEGDDHAVEAHGRSLPRSSARHIRCLPRPVPEDYVPGRRVAWAAARSSAMARISVAAHAFTGSASSGS